MPRGPQSASAGRAREVSEEQNDFDERYVRFRDHADLRERVTKLESRLEHVPAKLDNLNEKIGELTLAIRTAPIAAPPAVTSSLDAAALALHRSLDSARGNSLQGNFVPAVGLGAIMPVAIYLAWSYFTR